MSHSQSCFTEFSAELHHCPVLISDCVLVSTGVAIAKDRGATLRSGPELEIRFGLTTCTGGGLLVLNLKASCA